MLYLVLVAYIISLMQVNLTGGGEQFLLAQAQNGSTQIMWGGHSRRTWEAGVAPTTAPISIRFAT